MANKIEKDTRTLEEKDRNRRVLISDVAYDLKTPVQIEKRILESLLNKNVSKQEREDALTVMKNSISMQEDMIQDLFEISKLEAQELEPEYERFPIRELFELAASRLQILGENKNISLDLDCPEELTVDADPVLLQRAVDNLVKNALVAAKACSLVTLRAAGVENSVLIEVRYETEDLDAEEENGLGLSIVKRILEIHKSTFKKVILAQDLSAYQFKLSTP